MAARNRIITEFTADGTWTAPAGVTRVTARVFAQLGAQISSYNTTVALTMNGTAYAFGVAADGQLGDGTVVAKSSPVLVLGGLAWRQVSAGQHVLGITTAGDAYGWGQNIRGQIGVGDVTPRSSPVLVLGGLKWRQIIAAGTGFAAAHSLGLDISGNAYGWGSSADGQVGDGTTVAKSSPVLVLGGLTFQRLAANNGHCAGISTAGDLYCWGLNLQGELGVGDRIPRSSPVLVLGGLKWQQVACGAFHTIGITTAGVAYAWGLNSSNQLGDGTGLDQSSPVLVLGGKVFRWISAGANSGMGITTDGDAYGWGSDINGEIGDGAIGTRASPTLVLGGLKWRQISMGTGTTTAGITTKGAAYAWGTNTQGSLGDGTIVTKSSPVLVVGGLLWRSIDRPVLAEEYVTVIPGNTYAVTVIGAIAAFGPASLYTDALGTGSLPVKVTLEYFG